MKKDRLMGRKKAARRDRKLDLGMASEADAAVEIKAMEAASPIDTVQLKLERGLYHDPAAGSIQIFRSPPDPTVPGIDPNQWYTIHIPLPTPPEAIRRMRQIQEDHERQQRQRQVPSRYLFELAFETRS